MKQQSQVSTQAPLPGYPEPGKPSGRLTVYLFPGAALARLPVLPSPSLWFSLITLPVMRLPPPNTLGISTKSSSSPWWPRSSWVLESSSCCSGLASTYELPRVRAVTGWALEKFPTSPLAGSSGLCNTLVNGDRLQSGEGYQACVPLSLSQMRICALCCDSKFCTLPRALIGLWDILCRAVGAVFPC